MTLDREVGTQRSARKYRPDIDGLRAVAIVLVVGYHVEVPGFTGGFIGVDVFFVISGFLITGLLLRELEDTGRIQWMAFYARRVRRLVPAAVLMLLVVLVVSLVLLNPLGEQQGLAKSAIAAAGSASNIYFWQVAPVDYFGGAAIGTQALLHTWSLSVEEQFYAAMPIAVLVALWIGRRRRLSPRRALILTCAVMTVSSLAVAVWSGASHPTAAFYAPVTRAYEFGCGALLALAPPALLTSRRLMRTLGGLGVVGIAGCLLFPLPTVGFPSAWALVPVISSVALIAVGGHPSTRARWLTRGLSTPFFVWLGRVSYSWYLWHWPLITLAGAYNLGPVPWSYRLICALAALGVAAFSYRFVELKFHHSPNPVERGITHVSVKPGRVLLIGGAALALCAMSAGALGLIARIAKTTPQWEPVAEEIADIPVLPDACADDLGNIMGSGAPCEVKNGSRGAGTLVLWGDSHSWQYLPAVEAAASDDEVSVTAWSLGGCPAYLAEGSLDLSSLDEATATAILTCRERNEDALTATLRLAEGREAVRVILAARWTPYLGAAPISLTDISAFKPGSKRILASQIDPGLEDLVAILVRAGVGVDVVAPIPELLRPAPTCLARSAPFVLDCDVSRARTDEYHREAVALLRDVMATLPSDSRLIDVTGALCDQQTCFAESGGIVNYFDDDHLSATRSRALASYFDPSIEALEEAARPAAD